MLFILYQNKPEIAPFSSMSIFSAAGYSGNPGILIISPVIGITKPAPAAISIYRTVTTKSLGRPNNLGLSERDF